MNSLRLNLNEYLRNLDDIVAYIRCFEEQTELLYKMQLEEIACTGFDIKNMRQRYQGILRTPVAYNAVIISIYGCFEAYMDKISNAFLEFLTMEEKSYDGLPTRLKSKHLRKSGEFLSNPQRFRNYELTEEEVISNLYCCTVNQDFLLNKKLLVSHAGNLKIEQVIELLADIGIDDGKGRIISNDKYIEYIAVKNEQSFEAAHQFINIKNQETENMLFEELDELVDQRNKVAHGWCVDARISNTMLLEKTIPFMRMFGEVICQIFEDEAIRKLYKNGSLMQFDAPIAVYRNKILCINCKSATLKCGGFIYGYNEKQYRVLKILNIEVDGQKVDEVTENNIAVGIQLDAYIKDKWTYFYT